MSAYFFFFRQVLWLAMWCLLFVVNGGQVVAQSSPLYADQSYLYTPVRLSHGDRERTVRALIDTGCSFCVIDSTFAIDSCGWDSAALAPLHTRAASGARTGTQRGVGACGLLRHDFYCSEMSCCRPEGEILTLRAELHYRGESAECPTALL